MDENFLTELASEGEKKFSFTIPLGMSLGDAFRNLEGTVGEVLRASSDWQDTAGLRSMVVVEAMSWQAIFKQSASAVGEEADGALPLESGGAEKLLAIAQSGSKLMKHFFIQGKQKADEIEMFFVFRLDAGPRFISTIDFG